MTTKMRKVQQAESMANTLARRMLGLGVAAVIGCALGAWPMALHADESAAAAPVASGAPDAATTQTKATPLAWDNIDIDRIVSPDATEMKVQFAFRNTSDHVINIVTVKTSCSCTIAELADKEIAPGETGHIDVTLEMPEISSRQKTIFVQTDDATHPSYVLTVAGRKTGYVNMVAPDLSWHVGDPATPRTVTFTTGSDLPVHVVSVEADEASVAVTQETLVDGKSWSLTVAPRKTTEALVTKVLIVTDLPVKVGNRFTLDVWVLEPLPPPALPDGAATPAP